MHQVEACQKGYKYLENGKLVIVTIKKGGVTLIAIILSRYETDSSREIKIFTEDLCS